MIWLFWFVFLIAFSEDDEPMTDLPPNVVDMKAQAKLIQEAKEARAKRKAERAKFPGGIDDMELG